MMFLTPGFQEFFRIADVDICIRNLTEYIVKLPSFDAFVIRSERSSEFTFLVYGKSYALKDHKASSSPDCSFECSIGLVECRRLSSDSIYSIYSDSELIGEFSITSGKTIFIRTISERNVSKLVNFVVLFVYSNLCQYYEILLIHASVVVKNNKAYIFYGKSGIGKSTQSQHWIETYPDAWILNDDSPLIRIEGTSLYVYGSPWSGQSHFYKQKKVLVKALISMGQSKGNKLYPFKEKAFLVDFLGSCCYNPLNTDGILAMLRIIYRVFNLVNTYRFNCINDVSVAKYLYKSLHASFISNLDFINIINRAREEKLLIRFTVQGNSMYPLLKSGITKVVITPTVSSLHVDDIVLAIHQDKLILHRVVEINENELCLKGDDNCFTEIINRDNILAKVVKIE